MMPKPDTIDAILRLNPGAAPTFLAEFSSGELNHYLQRLTDTHRQSPAVAHAAPEQPLSKAAPASRQATGSPAV